MSDIRGGEFPERSISMMNQEFQQSRRGFLWQSAALSAGVWLGRGGVFAAEGVVQETKVISFQPEYYQGWPTVIRRANGELVLVYSGGREEHVCPFGRLELMRSFDEGKTWSWPCVILDPGIDTRDAGILETAQGTLLVSTFTSLDYLDLLSQGEQIPAGTPGAWEPEKLKRWRAARARLTDVQRRSLYGVWMIRSTDGGATWSAPYRCGVDSPHGPIQLADGRLLYAGKAIGGDERVGVCESRDDGVTWEWLAEIPQRAGDNSKGDYHELHLVEAGDGRLVVQIRNHNPNNFFETLQTESTDGGKSWTVPHSIGVWGLPAHLLRLADGRLLMSYGYRREPYGNQARVSEDQGRNWSEPITISGDGAGIDLGYPSTVQLTDGSLLTVWYELLKGSSRAVLRQARWSLGG